MNNYQGRATAYKSMEVTSSNRLKIIVMVYDAAIASLRQAIETHGRADMTRRNQYLSRTQFIILELNSALDMQRGGEISQNLRNLYHFLNRHLGDAINHNDLGKVRESLNILEHLREAWHSIAQHQTTAAPAGSDVYHGATTLSSGTAV